MITVKIHDNDYKCDYLKNTQTDLVALTFACRHSCDYDYINAVMLLTAYICLSTIMSHDDKNKTRIYVYVCIVDILRIPFRD